MNREGVVGFLLCRYDNWISRIPRQGYTGTNGTPFSIFKPSFYSCVQGYPSGKKWSLKHHLPKHEEKIDLVLTPCKTCSRERYSVIYCLSKLDECDLSLCMLVGYLVYTCRRMKSWSVLVAVLCTLEEIFTPLGVRERFLPHFVLRTVQGFWEPPYWSTNK